MKFFETATLGVKGQVVMLSEARKTFKLKEGEKLLVFSAPVHQSIVLIKSDSLESSMTEA